MAKFKRQKISEGHYLYRGFKVYSVGYYEPDHKVCWEAEDHDGSGFAHSFRLRDTLNIIDYELEKEEENKRKINAMDYE